MTSGTERKSLWIPWLFVGGFAIILIANGIMALVAFDSWSGLATDDPYRRGLAYNDALAENAAQRALGWRVATRFRPLATDSRRGTLVVRLRDADGRALTGATLTAVLRRPVAAGSDITLRFRAEGGGWFRAAVSFPAAGVWQARYHVRRNGASLVAHQRLQVR